jgi:hypothetical protein
VVAKLPDVSRRHGRCSRREEEKESNGHGEAVHRGHDHCLVDRTITIELSLGVAEAGSGDGDNAGLDIWRHWN